MGRAEEEEREPRYWSEGSTLLLLKTIFELLLKFIKTGFYWNQLCHTQLFVKPFHTTVIKSWQIKHQTSQSLPVQHQASAIPPKPHFLAGLLQAEISRDELGCGTG